MTLYAKQYARDRKLEARRSGQNEALHTFAGIKKLGYVSQTGQFFSVRCHDSEVIAALLAGFLTDPRRLKETYELRALRVSHARYFRCLYNASRLP